jgi:hypothetical protein
VRDGVWCRFPLPPSTITVPVATIARALPGGIGEFNKLLEPEGGCDVFEGVATVKVRAGRWRVEEILAKLEEAGLFRGRDIDVSLSDHVDTTPPGRYY